jgi:hypothetical protein
MTRIRKGFYPRSSAKSAVNAFWLPLKVALRDFASLRPGRSPNWLRAAAALGVFATSR